MATVKKIYEYLNEIAPFEKAMTYDNCGLIIGNEDEHVKNVLVTLDITKEVIKEAKEKKVNLIISHHPIIFKGIKKISFDSVIAKLIENNINSIAVHTNFDLAKKGVNFQLAKALKLKEIIVLPDEEYCVIVGKIEEEMQEIEFAKYIKDKLNCKGVRFTNLNKNIKTVAVSCGAGGKSVDILHSLDVDALVTGEIRHNEILQATENNIAVFDAGHYKTEDIAILPLVKMLNKKFDKVKFMKSETFADKVEYI